MSEANGRLRIECQGAGKNGHVLLSANLDDQLIAHDTVDLSKQKSRDGFVEQVVRDRPGIDRNEVAQKLMELGEQRAKQQSADHDKPREDDSKSRLSRMPASVVDRARAMLESPDLLVNVLRDAENLGIAGEQELVMSLYLIGTSRLLDKPLAAIVQGPSSSGKSYTIEKVADMFPDEAVLKATSITPNALYYCERGKLSHRFVVVGERSRVEDDETAEKTRALRELLSQGVLIKLIAERTSSGEMVSRQIEQPGPIAYVESTTLTQIFAEDANRCIMLATDEQREQTRRIVNKLAKGYAGRQVNVSGQDVLDRHHAAQRLLDRRQVVVPFAVKVGELIPHQKVEVRRAFPQLIAMTKASALLRQFQRKQDADGCVIATDDDYQLARRLLAPAMRRLLGGATSDAAARFHRRIMDKFPVGESFKTSDAAKDEDVTRRQVSGWLRELADKDKIDEVESGHGRKPAIWKLRANGDHLDCPDLPTVEAVFSTS